MVCVAALVSSESWATLSPKRVQQILQEAEADYNTYLETSGKKPKAQCLFGCLRRDNHQQPIDIFDFYKFTLEKSTAEILDGTAKNNTKEKLEALEMSLGNASFKAKDIPTEATKVINSNMRKLLREARLLCKSPRGKPHGILST